MAYNPNSAIIISIPFNGIPDNANRIMVWDVDAKVIQIINTLDNTVYAELIGGSIPAYKVYTALLNQSGTDAPVPTVLENTLGEIIWTRNSVGFYTATSSFARFVLNKTICFTTFGNFLSDPTNAAASYTTDSTVTLNTMIPTDNNYDVFSNLAFEIRVYN
jgi:hypothetical protein